MIVLYSCITGRADNIIRSTANKPSNVRCVLFSDEITTPVETNGWELKPLVYRHPLCLRRTARWHKINSHLLFPESTDTVWSDGSQQWKGEATFDSLMAHLTGLVATFKHPDRICIYQERDACLRFRKDVPAVMDPQMQRYRQEGYPPFNGLVETSCLLRRTTPKVAAFNEAWWQQLDQGSFRDQLSFNYVAHVRQLDYNIVPGCRDKNDWFRHHTHKK